MKITIFFLIISIILGCTSRIRNNYQNWPRDFQEKLLPQPHSTGTSGQLAKYYSPSKPNQPLIMFLHGWSEDYKSTNGIPFAVWCKQNNWGFISPNFGGVFDNPGDLGGKKIYNKILNARDWAVSQFKSDTTRLYLIAVSGGAIVALNFIFENPHAFSGASLWSPVTDLRKWHQQLQNTSWRYLHEMENILQGSPTNSPKVYQQRSPIHKADSYPHIPLDIHAGIKDGKHGPVPFSHSIDFFNRLCSHSLNSQDTIPQGLIQSLRTSGKIPPGYISPPSKQKGLTEPILYQKKCNGVTLSLFKGAHVVHPMSSIQWVKQLSNSK